MISSSADALGKPVPPDQQVELLGGLAAELGLDERDLSFLQ
jgi:hypothetical protein